MAVFEEQRDQMENSDLGNEDIRHVLSPAIHVLPPKSPGAWENNGLDLGQISSHFEC